MTNNNAPFIKDLQSQLVRHFLAGHRKWSENDLSIALAGGPKIDAPEVQAVLRDWEKQGAIELIGSGDCYFEIIKPFPGSMEVTDEKIKTSLNVLQARLNRFFSEGHLRWSKKDVQCHLEPGIQLENERLQSIFRDWEKQGVIRLVRNTDIYWEVLKPFP
jgi:hypothetical protein